MKLVFARSWGPGFPVEFEFASSLAFFPLLFSTYLYLYFTFSLSPLSPYYSPFGLF